MYYKHNPGRLDPLLPIDATFPLFIAAELPPGVDTQADLDRVRAVLAARAGGTAA